VKSTGASYREERIRLLSRIARALEADDRAVAAWLAGSVGRGDDDELSDLDLWIAVEDAAMEGIVASPSSFVHTILPVKMEIAAPQNAPDGGAYLLTWVGGDYGPQQVDWYWQPAELATRGAGTNLLFQRREIPLTDMPPPLLAETLEQKIDLMVRETLLMAFIARKHVVRGNPWVTSRHLVHVARCVATVKWLIAHGRSPAHDDWLELRLPASILMARHDQLIWIRGALERLTTLLAHQRPGILDEHAEALNQLQRWLDWMGAEEAELE